MSNIWHDISPSRIQPEDFVAVIEIPKGSKKKYELEIDPLTLVRCYPIGYISMLDGGKNDEKIIAIPFSDPTYNPYHDLMDLPPHLFDEMKHFFSVYKALEGKQAVAKDVNDRAAAVQVIRQAMDHYAECFLGGPSAKVGLYPTEPDQPTAPEGKGK